MSLPDSFEVEITNEILERDLKPWNCRNCFIHAAVEAYLKQSGLYDPNLFQNASVGLHSIDILDKQFETTQELTDWQKMVIDMGSDARVNNKSVDFSKILEPITIFFEEVDGFPVAGIEENHSVTVFLQGDSDG